MYFNEKVCTLIPALNYYCVKVTRIGNEIVSAVALNHNDFDADLCDCAAFGRGLGGEHIEKITYTIDKVGHVVNFASGAWTSAVNAVKSAFSSVTSKIFSWFG